MKTKDELKNIREEYEKLGKKLAELTAEELSQVVGGVNKYLDIFEIDRGGQQYDINIYTEEPTDDFKPKFTK